MAQNTLHTVFREVGEVFRPLRFLDSEIKVTTLFHDLGYVLPGGQRFAALPAIVPRIQGIIDALQQFTSAGTDDEKLDAILELADEIRLLIPAINSLETDVANLMSGISGFVANAPLDELPRRLIDYLLVEYTKSNRPKLHGILAIIALFDTEDLSSNPAIFQPEVKLRRINWENIPKYFSAPHEVFNTAYNWDADFNTDLFFERLDDLLKAFLLPGGLYDQSDNLKAALQNPDSDLKEIRMPLFQNGTWPSTFSQFGVIVTPAQARSGLKKGMGIFPYVFGAANFDFDLNEEYEIVLNLNATLDAGLGIVIRPPFDLSFIENIFSSPQDAASFLIEFLLQRREGFDEENIIFGSANASRLSMQGVRSRIFASNNAGNADFGVEVGLDEIKIVIKGGEGDGFLQKVLPEDGIDASFALKFGYSIIRGFYFDGSGTLEIAIASHIQIGPISIDNLKLGLTPSNEGLALTTTTDIGLELGPFVAVVEGIGLSTDLTFPNGGGNLGPADLDFGFKPPSGVGLSLDAGVVKGGGFLRFYPDQGRYDGILQLSIKEVVNVVAIGLISTKGPNGEEGQFSLLLMITAEFTPIQLGFGFTLNGVGGIIAVNRSMDLEALRVGVRSSTLDNILFPADPIANATQIISDLETIFPQVQRRYAFGLMGKLGWGTPTLITLELGLILEVPNPIKLAILGVIKMALPTEEAAILKLQVNFLGTIDFEAKYITFDASLFDSKLLAFTLEGDMALRIKWGDQSNFLFSVGGFHPSYTPPPLNLPEMRRLSIGLLTGNPRLTVSTYFAVTSNTVQFGAAVDFYFGVSKFKVIGYLHFDALFQFDPFYFNISLAAGLGVYIGSSEILSIHLSGMLEGPTPWHITGRVKFKIFWVVSISVSVETTWGENKDTSLPDVDVLPKLKAALENKANWLTPLESDGENPDHLVSLRTIENTDEDIIAHPNRSLSVSQKVVPLDITIEKFGTQNPGDYTRFTLDMVDGDGELLSEKQLTEEFAPDSFFKLKESERLSRPSFEKYNSGIEGTGSSELTSDYFRERDVMFEQKILDEPDPVPIMVSLAANEFSAFIKGGSAAKSTISARETRPSVLAPNAVSIADESVSIANIDDMSLFEDNQFPSVMEAQEAINSLIADRPDLEGQLEVVPTFELA